MPLSDRVRHPGRAQADQQWAER